MIYLMANICMVFLYEMIVYFLSLNYKIMNDLIMIDSFRKSLTLVINFVTVP